MTEFLPRQTNAPDISIQLRNFMVNLLNGMKMEMIIYSCKYEENNDEENNDEENNDEENNDEENNDESTTEINANAIGSKRIIMLKQRVKKIIRNPIELWMENIIKLIKVNDELQFGNRTFVIVELFNNGH